MRRRKLEKTPPEPGCTSGKACSIKSKESWDSLPHVESRYSDTGEGVQYTPSGSRNLLRIARFSLLNCAAPSTHNHQDGIPILLAKQRPHIVTDTDRIRIPLCYNRSDIPRYRGVYADVWKGEYQGCSVAAKVLKLYSTSDFDKITRRLCKEAMAWKTLSHPNVLPLLGVTIDNNQFVMVSEWMANGNINEFIKARNDVNRFELLKDVARGLKYMHDQAMVHGDLKGANILIDPNGNARLADFGLLTIISDPTSPTASSSFAIGGTTRWMSPELLYPDLSGLKVARPTKQSDCYALGMVIYEVLSGQAPFTPFHHDVVMRKVIEGERPGRPDGPGGAWFTDDLWQTLNQCWVVQPKCRPSIGAVLECLERVSRGHPLSR
ncbi:kinase-like protein [Thelephora ganbajun]|uniref:Kinase-like protein n=1 Tax=Thelephora ganbajun TaxID=370292 RepID=A0ACB6Z0C4_THEGA|nr:kinase-like protein [Thelephora ganbajun]